MNDSPANVTEKGVYVRPGVIVAISVFIADQLSKWAILGLFVEGPRVIEVTSFFNIVLAWNRGISFGMFGASGEAGRWVLVGLAIVISAFLAVWLMKADTRFTALGLALIIGGAVGNVIDRARFGAVIDFLDFYAWGYHWPAFNVADSAIVVGAAALILESLFSGQETP